MEVSYVQLAFYILGSAVTSTVVVTVFVTTMKADFRVQCMEQEKDISRIDRDLARIEETIRELRYGRGFIHINGEYDSKGKVDRE